MRRNNLKVLLAVVVLAASACSDSADPSDSAPLVPPVATMRPDLSYFEQLTAAGDAVTAGLAGSSYTSAAFAVGVASIATVIVLAAPAAAFSTAMLQDPIFVDGAFHWRYNALASGNSYQVDLSAAPEGDLAFWEMRVTSATHAPPLANFLWVSGQSSLAADQGVWHLFDAGTPGTQTEILRVDWTYQSKTDHSLTLTNVHASSADVGDKLEFSADGDIKTMRFTDASAATQALVQWNTATNVGFIVAPNVNGGVRACWNVNLANTACS